MRKISIKLWISLVFISVITTGALALFMAKHVVNEQQSDGVKINIAGRQRMLTQKMSKDAFLEFYSMAIARNKLLLFAMQKKLSKHQQLKRSQVQSMNSIVKLRQTGL